MRRIAALGFVLAAAGLAVLAPLPAQTDPSQAAPRIVRVAQAPGRAAVLRGAGLDLVAEWDGGLFIAAPERALRTLTGMGLAWAPVSLPRAAAAEGGPNGAFHTAAELEGDLRALERKFPSLAKVRLLGRSLEGRPIYALKISARVVLDEDEAEVLILGAHHAREWISVEVPYRLAVLLLEHYGDDEEIRRLLDGAAVWIVPLVNPDGLEYSIRTYRFWRKNRRANGDGTFGVDLNRNYDCMWGLDDDGSSPEPASEIYRGREAFSEPETRAVAEFFAARDIRAVVSYHSYSQTILYPWGYTPDLAADASLMDELGRAMAARIREVNGRIYAVGASGRELYLTNGDATDWTYFVRGVPSFTIELPPADLLDGAFFNAESEIEPLSRENLPAVAYLMDWCIRGYRPPPLSTSPSRIR